MTTQPSLGMRRLIGLLAILGLVALWFLPDRAPAWMTFVGGLFGAVK
jgi:hypothetical protein